MEVGRDDEAWICVRRCLWAMGETQDVETRRALWRAACKYMRRAEGVGRTDGLEFVNPAPRTRHLGRGDVGGGARWGRE